MPPRDGEEEGVGQSVGMMTEGEARSLRVRV